VRSALVGLLGSLRSAPVGSLLFRTSLLPRYTTVRSFLATLGSVPSHRFTWLMKLLLILPYLPAVAPLFGNPARFRTSSAPLVFGVSASSSAQLSKGRRLYAVKLSPNAFRVRIAIWSSPGP